jgi:hypothetical protein
LTGSPQTLPPWSPLNDPQLSARFQKNLGSRNETVRSKAQFQLDLLSRYAWQEFPVKYGCWALSETGVTGGTNLSGPWTKRSYTPDYSWILLLDPGSGRPVARHWIDTGFDGGLTVKDAPFPPGAASIWFAGDPRAFGMFSPVGNGHIAYFGSRDRLQAFDAWRQGPQHYAQWAATIGDAMDRRPAGPDADVLWLADHPQAPPSPRRFGAGRG